jgi:methyltransferase (TIGR00027 family)
MEENQNGITALITAFFRAYHATHDTPKIFDDFLAPRLYTPEETVTFSGHMAQMIHLVDPEHAADYPDPERALAHVMQIHNGPITLSRSRYTEDLLDQALEAGVQQYVILGAGFDTFAFRRPELVGRLQIFEVDHPVTQAMKRQRLGMLEMDFPQDLHFVPINFTTDSLSLVLRQAGFDPHQSSFISWLGVTYYLTREVVFDTLRTLAGLAPAGSQIVFDYMDSDAFNPEKVARGVRVMQDITRQIGEPMKAGFEPQELAEDLEHLGLRVVEDLGPVEIESRYFQGRTDDYHAFQHVHFARAVVV